MNRPPWRGARRRPLSARAALAWALRRRRTLLIGTAAAALVALIFLIRFLAHLWFWERAPEGEPLAPWMTLGYVARAHDVDRGALARAVGVDPDLPVRVTLGAIARQTGRPLPEIEAELRAAIDAERAADLEEDR